MISIIRILLMLFLICESLWSQTYTLSGEVKDINNKPLPNVNIMVAAAGIGTSSNDVGSFSIPGISPGEYQVEFSSLGYEDVMESMFITDRDTTLYVTMLEKAVETDQIIITAGKYEQNAAELPVSASVLPAEEIAKRNFTNLEDIMRYIPGLNMTDDQVSIRGSSGYSRGAGTRVLLAIDGIPFSTGDTGEIIWDIIPVTQIQRVEVIKGAASSLYGSNAIGGVINIITNSIAEQSQTYIKALAGVYDKPSYPEWDWSGKYRKYNALTLSHSRRIENFGVAASISRLEDESYKQSGFYHRYLGFLKASYNFTPKSFINVFFNSINQRNGNFIYWKDSHNVLVPPDEDQGQRIRTNRYMAGAHYTNIINSNLFFDVKASYYRTHWEDQTTSANNSKTNLFRGEVQSTYSFNRSTVIVSGIEASYSKVNSNLFGSPDSKSAGIYTQADYRFDFPFLLSLGARFDYSQLDTLDAFSNFSPKLGINYTLSDNLILRSSVGAGFRAPTLAEAFTSTTASGIVVKPNPSLIPEKSLSIEIGINYTFAAWLTLDGAAFQNEFYDYIEPGVDRSDGRVIFDNVVRARIQGFELNSVIHPAKFLKLGLNYTFLWARDIERKKALKYRPRHIFSASVDYSLNSFEAGADFRFWSKVEEIDFELIDLGLIPDGEVRDDVYVLDLRSGYNFASAGIPLRLNLTANNVLNYYYVELIGNLAPIRNISLSAEVVF